uniref:Uncharacterized protein n=1 Tax=Oryza punctata TaxID=4537 RepID=A0A0E0JZH9_ORYPU
MTVNDAGVALGTPLARKNRAVFFKVHHRKLAARLGCRADDVVEPTRQAEEEEKRKDRPKRERMMKRMKMQRMWKKRTRKRKRITKWSSIPSSYRTHHSHHRGAISTTAQESSYLGLEVHPDQSS